MPEPTLPREDDTPFSRDGWAVLGRAIVRAPREFAVGAAGALLYAVMTVVSAEAIGYVTDELVVPSFEAGELVTGAVWTSIAFVLGVSVLRAVGIAYRRYGAYKMQYRLQADHRRAVTRRYLELPIAWHRRRTTGDLLSNANADVEAAFWIAAPLPLALAATLMVVIAVVLLFLADPVLAVLGLLVGPVLGGVNVVYMRSVKALATDAQARRGTVSRIAHESFDAALVVKTLGREEAETERFREESDTLRDRMVAIGRRRAMFDPIVEALPNIATLLVLYVGAQRVADGVLTTGELVQFAYLLRLIALPVRVFGWMFGDLPRAIAGWRRVDEVLQAEGSMAYGQDLTPDDGPAAATAREVSFEHPRAPNEAEPGTGADGEADVGDGVRGVDGLDLDVSPGRTIAVVGPTGSGKSTIAALLVRLFDPEVGGLQLDGRDLRELSRETLAEDIAIVFQDAFLFDDTVAFNISLGARVDPADISDAARIAQADAFVSQLADGYATQVGERGAALSGGQRQRVALARALLKRPRLLVLDDATSAVDPSVEQAILTNLRSSGLATTVVLIAYRRSSIVLADEVVFVEDGHVSATGSHEHLMATVPAYEDLLTAYEQPEGRPGRGQREHAGAGEGAA